MSLYELSDVTVRFRSRKDGRGGAETVALDRVSLTIDPGELVAIRGPSGSGKSTLLHVMAGLVPVDGGTVTFCAGEGEIPVSMHGASEDERARTRRHHIGFVYQAFHLLPRLSAAENVELPLLFAGRPPGARHASAMDMLMRFGLAERGARYPYELSGGEQQRVAIARALVAGPAVVLADEPTGSLDSVSADGVVRLLRSLNELDGVTIVVVTHDVTLAYKLDSRVIELRDGAVISNGDRA
jgi:ABC-type lipoprotein export system ATPase subunit